MGKNKQTWRSLWSGRSIVVKLFISVLACLLLVLTCNWMINNLVLEKYYRQQKQNSLVDVFNQVNDLYENGAAGDLQLNLDIISSGGNYNMILLSNQYVYYSMIGGPYTNLNDFLMEMGGITGDFNSLSPGEYAVQTLNNVRVNQKYLTLMGRLNSGPYLMVNTPLQAISESVDISNRFLLVTGFFSLALSGFFIFWIARSFSRPILELSEITTSISQLDFSRKYERGGKDEIGRLGESVNRLSTELEKNLTQLKTANAQLVRDNEMKTKQDALRREFISNASHELKTPIALIMAYAEGLEENVSTDAESRRYYCEVIRDEAEKMSVLVKKMTALMQLESGAEELNIQRFEIGSLIEDVLKRYSIILEQRGIAFSFDHALDLYVWGDEYFIENVLNNYISNAVHHVSQNGSIQIKMEQKENEERVRISVYNSGDPIPQKDLTRIWESFYKVDKARSRAYGGTGIGLSVVAAIMNAHHMPYGVENCLGGVLFWFELESGDKHKIQ